MAIRLRVVNGVPVALCATETDERAGDIYLDDAWHHALAAKFAHDYGIKQEGVIGEYPDQWALMDTQKKRNAEDTFDIKETL